MRQNEKSEHMHSFQSQQLFRQQDSESEKHTFDFLDSYKSEQDEDYSEKEDLIQNKKHYAKDLQNPFQKNIPKAEVEYLLKEQQYIDYFV